MITGILSNGFEVQIDKSKIKTYRFTKLIGKSASPDAEEKMYATSCILEYLIGEKGEEALIEYTAEVNGHEPTAKEISDLTVEIINMMKDEDEEIKKS